MIRTHFKRNCIPICFISLLCLTLPSPSAAQETAAATVIQRIEIPSSPNPVGSGARALGMGGAFIAIADDATAASWNPGGLAILDRPEISIVGAGVHRVENNDFRTHPGAGGDESVSDMNVNYASAAYPFTLWGRHMVASLNYQRLYDFTRQWDFSFSESDGTGTYRQQVDYRTEGALTALGLAYCIQATPSVSLGVTLNIWDEDFTENEWENRLLQYGTGTVGGERFTETIRSRDRYGFSGVNVNIGALWRNVANTGLTIGAVIKTPFRADLDHDHRFEVLTQYPDLPSRYDQRFSTAFDRGETLDMPLSYGIGVSYRFSDVFTTSLDIYRTEWDDFILTDGDGNRMSPITGRSPGDSGIDPTWQVRAGGEYLAFQTDRYLIPLTFGLFYDPAPATGSPDDIYGFAIGSGYADKRWFTFDFAYQFRFGNDVGASALREFGFEQDLREHTVYGSVIVYF